ncbi:MAG TPA: Rne/Rng family ribonuclease [Polyangia bacterium]|nr:Rne/Rng family ribonuclease [Polyangia bacterium]
MAGDLLVINADGPETRVALIEKGQLVELYIERRRERGIVGNIYKGRVRRVLPGMQAAFVDIGVEKAAFLYVADVRGAPEDFKSLFLDSDEPQKAGATKGKHDARIEDLVKENQEILIQVAKGPIGTKGARSTAYVSLPGRNLVFMPTVDHVGISRRIGNEKERKRLRGIIDSMRPEGAGFIVRTVAEGVSEKELRADMEFLIKLWNSILKKNQTAKAPALLYNDLDLLLRTVRDLFTPEVDKLIVDSRSEYERLMKFVAAFMPDFQGKIELYEGREPIFDGYGIEAEIDRGLERKVFLKSGGSLIIDQGEALTAIDVNTGKFVGRRSLEETITKTNLEACKEVADQLRLRNIGGMIIVDFIDMDREQNREKVMRAFEECLKHDKAKANVTKISELGLVEMTRKRTRESLGRMLTEPCPYCEGKGYIKSKTTVCYEILRELRRDGHTFAEDTIVVTCNPEIADLLVTVEQQYIDELEKRLQKKVVIQSKKRFHLEKFEIQGRTPQNSAGESDGIGGGGPA